MSATAAVSAASASAASWSALAWLTAAARSCAASPLLSSSPSVGALSASEELGNVPARMHSQYGVRVGEVNSGSQRRDGSRRHGVYKSRHVQQLRAPTRIDCTWTPRCTK